MTGIEIQAPHSASTDPQEGIPYIAGQRKALSLSGCTDNSPARKDRRSCHVPLTPLMSVGGEQTLHSCWWWMTLCQACHMTPVRSRRGCIHYYWMRCKSRPPMRHPLTPLGHGRCLPLPGLGERTGFPGQPSLTAWGAGQRVRVLYSLVRVEVWAPPWPCWSQWQWNIFSVVSGWSRAVDN